MPLIHPYTLKRKCTKCTTGMRDCSYSDRLSLLRLYSLQRRRERYCIIYVWKIIEDLVHIFSKKTILSVEEDIVGTFILEHVSEIMADMIYQCNYYCRHPPLSRLHVLR